MAGRSAGSCSAPWRRCRFAELLDQVRRELAQRYIADPRLALGEVAYLLGFAEPSPFHRAFRRWTGMTPAAARRQQAEQALAPDAQRLTAGR